MGPPSCDSAAAAENSTMEENSRPVFENVEVGVPITEKTASWKDVPVELGLCATAEVSSEDDDEVEAMDLNKWKDFPEELLMPVLARLPLQSIFQLRSVCKKWDTLLHNASFFEMCSQIRSQAPFLVRQADEGYAAYNSASNSWHFWPYSFILSNYFVSMLITSSVPFWEAGAAGGLLLLEGYGKHGRVLHLTNPINKSQKQLPLVHELQDSSASTIVGMVVDKNSGSYKILAVDHGIPDEMFLYDYQGGMEDEDDAEGTVKFYVYDSKCNSWEMTGRWERGVRRFFRRPAFHNGSLYCLTSDLEAFHLSDSPPMYHVFCVDGGSSWHELPAPIPSLLNFAHLFEMRGRLMLAGGKANVKGLLSVHIWQLDDEVDKVDKEWVEVMTMPDHLVQALFVPMEPYFRSHVSCVADGDYICVTSFSGKLNKCTTVMCHLSTNFWWLLPPYSKRTYSTTFLFEPRLDVIL